MPARTNRFLIAAGVTTLIQAAFQALYASFAIAQYYCVIDFLQNFPILIFIRILYFHNPTSCGSGINIGQSIDGVADQAFVLIQREPFTTERTFIINCISLGLSVMWMIVSILLIKGGTRKHHSNHTHWPWLMLTVMVTMLDIVAIISYANDSFHTQTLNQIMQYINGTASGMGSADLDTVFAAWLMVLIYSRFVVFLIVNGFLMVYTVVDCTRFRTSASSSELEHNPDSILEVESEGKESDEVTTSSPSVKVARIPRPGLSQSFRVMKNALFNRTSSNQPGSPRTSINGGRNRHRAVNFPEEIELPSSLENMILEQQRRLDMAMIDTASRRSPAQASRLTHAQSFNNLPETSRGRRGTAMELQLQGQMPWSYIPAPANRMRDQLPPDEDLPPVPLPDYTAIQSARKASVHRAASSLSSMTQKKEYMTYQSPHQAPATASAPVPVIRQVEMQAIALQEALDPDETDVSLTLRVPIDALHKASPSDARLPVLEPIEVMPIPRSMRWVQWVPQLPPRVPRPRVPRTPPPVPRSPPCLPWPSPRVPWPPSQPPPRPPPRPPRRSHLPPYDLRPEQLPDLTFAMFLLQPENIQKLLVLLCMIFFLIFILLPAFAFFVYHARNVRP